MCLIAADLILERIDTLLPLQVVDLLPLAEWITLALDPFQALIILQPLQLLVVFQLIELTLGLRGFRLLRLCRFAFLLFGLVELMLLLIEVLLALQVFELLLAF